MLASEEDDRGRDAAWPSQIPALGWKDIGWRLWEEFNKDRVLLVAAGATFYLLLALFPALAAFVSLYGFVADPRTVADHVAYLGSLLPSAGLDLIRQQLQALAAGIVLFLMVGVVPALLAYLYLDAWKETLITAARWPILLVAIVTGNSLLYRFGPSREKAKWRWLSWGALIATVVWIAASWMFSFYLQHFANYNVTYGSLGAVVGLMMWTWISVIILISGAAINAEMEHQTALDSTTGPPLPMGERGAVVADTLGKASD